MHASARKHVAGRPEWLKAEGVQDLGAHDAGVLASVLQFAGNFVDYKHALSVRNIR